MKAALVVTEMRLKDETILSIGMLCMAIGILVGRFTRLEYSNFGISDFLEGLLLGVSLVMNLTYLVMRRKDFSSK
jgi:1,4-dihydroxy-2-naphthoate octaprenyltransferase